MKKLVLGGLLAAALGSAALPAAARANVDFYVSVGPPPVYHEVVPAPRAGLVWVPGYWDWRHGRYYWVAGHWLRHRPGYYYEPARWHHRHHGRHHHGRPAEWRDYDHDGVPDRFDRAPFDPYWR